MIRPFALAAASLLALGFTGGPVQGAAAAEARELTLVQSAIGLGPAPDGSPIEVKTFYQGEKVRFYTKVSFDAARGSAATHRLVYKWYTGEAVSQSFDAQKQFDVSPTQWWAYIDVSHLSPGRHRAELHIDDRLFASGEFDIKASTRPHEPEEDTAIKDAARALLLAGDTGQFDQLASHYRTSQERTTSGTWKLSLLYNAIDDHSFAPTDPIWQKLQATNDAWLARQPDSPTAVALNARILYVHAWAWRGEGGYSTVPAENRDNYEQLIERARSVLDQHADIALHDPEWDTLRISIARQQGADTDEILAMADGALRRWPTFYPIHNAAVNALLPRSGGSRQAIQAYTKLALEHSHSEGIQAYARIYYYIARTAYRDPLDELNHMDAEFAPFQRSMAQVLERYPSSFNRDIARNMAYLAGDTAAYRAYGRASTAGVIPVAWWDTAKWRQWANEWAFEGKRATNYSPLRRVRAYFSFFRGQGPEFWNPLRWTILIAIVLIEGGFRLFDWWIGRRTRNPAVSQSRTSAFNMFDYPRAYHVMPLGRATLRVGFWLLVFSTGAAYTLTTVPWPNPEVMRLEMAVFIFAAALGALLVLNATTSRLILRSDELEWRRLLGSRKIQRGDIMGVRRPADEPVFEVVLRAADARPVLIPPVLSEDDAFRRWFESLPRLAEVEDDDAAVEHGSAG
jgi:hypothetical protein